MNERNTLALVKAAPLLYRYFDNPRRPYPIRYGFECGDGWFEILMRLSTRIEAELEVTHLAGRRKQDLHCAVQVKEKFGTLRFHLDGRVIPPAWRSWIAEASVASGKTCEKCGQPGETIINDGWYATRCPACVQSELLICT